MLKGQSLRQAIFREAHQAKHIVHPRATKMYKDIKEIYWWPEIKKDVAQYVVQCDTYQCIKIEHQHSGGLLQPLDIPK